MHSLQSTIARCLFNHKQYIHLYCSIIVVAFVWTEADPVELVTVTHIVTPGQFMVQRCSDKPALNKMLKKINEYCKKSHRNAIPSTIEIGKLYDCCFFSY
jgi:hypothetical protein